MYVSAHLTKMFEEGSVDLAQVGDGIFMLHDVASFFVFLAVLGMFKARLVFCAKYFSVVV